MARVRLKNHLGIRTEDDVRRMNCKMNMTKLRTVEGTWVE
jgi:hypothetical protein